MFTHVSNANVHERNCSSVLHARRLLATRTADAFRRYSRLCSMRQLKHHEKKLLKRVDFLQWKNEHNLRELQVVCIDSCKEDVIGRLLCP